MVKQRTSTLTVIFYFSFSMPCEEVYGLKGFIVEISEMQEIWFLLNHGYVHNYVENENVIEQCSNVYYTGTGFTDWNWGG